MRRFVKTTIILGALTLAPLAVTTPAFAKSRGLETTITAPLTTPIKVEVIIGEDLAHRAENLPKKRRDRGQSTRRCDLSLPMLNPIARHLNSFPAKFRFPFLVSHSGGPK